MKQMLTNDKGISFYKVGKYYYKNSGWLEREISKEEYEIERSKYYESK